MNIKKYKIVLGKPSVTGGECENPQVEVLGTSNILIECVDEARGEYEIQVQEGEEDRCFTFILSCGDCSDCPRKEITKCLCESSSDCGPCEDCIGSLCTSLCQDGEFCDDDNCVECNDEVSCPGDQVCKNGQCVCPQDKPFDLNGRCVECLGDTVNNCRECIDNVFVPIVCPGACDPSTSECVGCLQSSDCDGVNECCINRECACCNGFQRNQDGNCEPIPECSEDGDCGECGVCRNNRCESSPCPSGQVCIDGFGCVEECECLGDTPCSDPTRRCFPGSLDNCGCIPCTGDCANGCGDGCYCAGNQCIGNPCAAGNCPCSDGTDCPDGFGCQNGQCVPCATLNCTTNECGAVLGCACAGTVCVDADNACQNSTCTTSNDCGEGCTCFEGSCVACSNFPCNDCSRPGCECNGLFCEGVDTDCDDTFTLIKDDSSCTLTAQLNKTECCACDEITVDVRGKKVSETTSSVTLGFTSEVRKGAVANISNVTNLPLLDNIANPNINENDSPITGTVKLTYVINYDDYEILPNGTSVLIGPRNSTPVAQQVSFTTGLVSSLSFANITVPKISTETTVDNIRSVVRRVTITLENTNSFTFPNQCQYPEIGVLGEYDINSNNQYNSFSASLSNPIGEPATSGSCRLPVFRWFKSEDGNFSSPAFRKRYVSGTNTFSETLSTLAEGLESCKYFMVETDCSCEEDPSDYIVFCNPTNLDHEVTGCGFNFRLNSFSTCDINSKVGFRIQAGSIDITFGAGSAPVNDVLTSSIKIEEVIFSIACDTQDECTKVYPVAPEFGSLQLNFVPVCTGAGASVSVPFVSSDGGCQVQGVTVGGFFYSAGDTINLSSGTYTATVSWQCGCPNTTQSFAITCCDFNLPPISRTCNGGVTCSTLTGGVYRIDGVVQNDICSVISSLSLNDARTITVEVAGCPTRTINVPAILNNCCNGFSVVINRNTATTANIQVLGDSSPTVQLGSGNPNDNGTEIITNLGGGLFQASNLVPESSYVITVVSGGGCPPISRTILGVTDPNDCGLNTSLSTTGGANGACGLRATVAGQNCPCEQGRWNIEITSVVGTANPDQMSVQYEMSLLDFESGVQSSAVSLIDVGGLTTTDTAVSTGSKIVNKTYQNSQDCVPGSANIVQSPNEGLGEIVEITLTGSLTALTNLTINGQTSSGGNFYSFFVPEVGITWTFDITGEDNNSNVYTGSFTIVIERTATSTVGILMCTTNQIELPSTLSFRLDELILLDGCNYPVVVKTFDVKSDGTVTPVNPAVANLVATNPNGRKKKFIWDKDAVEVFSEYQYLVSNLPSEFLTQGSDYDVEVICNPCTETESIKLCCPIGITKTVSDCNDSVDITISAIPGNYNITFDGTTNAVVVGGGGTVTTTFAGQLAANSTFAGSVEPTGIASCAVPFTVNTGPACQTEFFTVASDAQDINQTDYLLTMKVVVGFGGASGNYQDKTVDNNPLINGMQTALINTEVVPVTPANFVKDNFSDTGFTAVQKGYYDADIAGSPGRQNFMCVSGPKGVGDWSFSYFISGGEVTVLYDDALETFTYITDTISVKNAGAYPSRNGTFDCK